MDSHLIVKKLVEHDEKLDNLVTKEEFGDFKDEFLTTMDEPMLILRRLDQEKLVTTHRLDEHEKEIVRIKATIKLD